MIMCEQILKKKTSLQYNPNSLNCKKTTMSPITSVLILSKVSLDLIKMVTSARNLKVKKKKKCFLGQSVCIFLHSFLIEIYCLRNFLAADFSGIPVFSANEIVGICIFRSLTLFAHWSMPFSIGAFSVIDLKRSTFLWSPLAICLLDHAARELQNMLFKGLLSMLFHLQFNMVPRNVISMTRPADCRNSGERIDLRAV